ncbi:MAG: DMT family transporter [Saprospiraceae bacterium]
MDKTGKTKYKGYAWILFGSILFSTKAVMVKIAFRDTAIDAISLLALRMLFAFPFFVVTGLISLSKAKGNLPTTRQWLYIFILGILGYYLSSLLDFLGLQFITAGLERLILFLYPTFVVLINAVLFKEKINRKQIWALGLSYFGLLITFWHEMHVGILPEHLVLGSSLIFLCAITFAGYIVGTGRLVKKVPPILFTSFSLIASTAGVFIHYIISGKFGLNDLHGNMVVYGMWLGIIATVIPNFLVSMGIKSIGANNAAILSAIGPVSTIILAYFFLGEKMDFFQIIGTLFVICGILLVTIKKRERIGNTKHG